MFFGILSACYLIYFYHQDSVSKGDMAMATGTKGDTGNEKGFIAMKRR
jgi:hypothetical protein